MPAPLTAIEILDRELTKNETQQQRIEEDLAKLKTEAENLRTAKASLNGNVG